MKKNWRRSPRQFSHIMCNGHQAPLRIHLFQIPEMKSSKAHIVFNVTEDGLDFHRAFGT